MSYFNRTDETTDISLMQ